MTIILNEDIAFNEPWKALVAFQFLNRIPVTPTAINMVLDMRKT
jgi:hypothetical protein